MKYTYMSLVLVGISPGLLYYIQKCTALQLVQNKPAAEVLICYLWNLLREMNVVGENVLQGTNTHG